MLSHLISDVDTFWMGYQSLRNGRDDERPVGLLGARYGNIEMTSSGIIYESLPGQTAVSRLLRRDHIPKDFDTV